MAPPDGEDGVQQQPRGLRDLAEIDAVFSALAHPTRRHVLQVLVARGSMSAGDLAKRFAHSWPTTTRHLNQLRDAGLVQVTDVGRTRRYSADVERLSGVLSLWLSGVGLAVEQRRAE
jgi:DNA-binding transcriptional ArsR family regulator